MARLRKALLTAGVLLGLAVAAGLVWHDAVVAAALRFGLSAGGFAEARFGDVEAGWTETVIAEFSLGPDLPSARAVRLRYLPGELASGLLRQVRVEGLRYQVPPDRRAALARFQRLASGDGGWLALGEVALVDAVIGLAEPEGGAITLDGVLDLSGDAPGAELEVALALGRAEASFSLRSDALGQGGVLEIRGSGTAELAGMAVPGRAGVVAAGGDAAFRLAGTVAVPDGDAALPAAWLGQALALEGDLRLEGVRAAALPGTMAADIAWTLRRDRGGLRLGLSRPAQLDLRGLGAQTLRDWHLAGAGGAGAAGDLSASLSADGPVLTWSPAPEGGVAAFAGDLAVRLGVAEAEVEASARLAHDGSWRMAAPAEVALRALASEIGLSGPQGAARLRRAEWSAEGSIGPDGAAALEGPVSARVESLALAGMTADAAALEGRVQLRAGRADWSLRLDPDAVLLADGVVLPGPVRLGGEAPLSFERLEVTGGDATRLGLTAQADGLSGVLPEAGGREIAFAGAGGRVALDLTLGPALQGEVRLSDAGARLPGEAVRLASVAGRLVLGGPPPGVALRLGAELSDSGRRARFAPFRIHLEGRPDGERLALAGELETLAGGLRLPLAGSADLAGMTGRVTAGPARLGFRPGGLQPGVLVPALAEFGEVAGAVDVSGELSLDPGGALDTRISLAFDGLGARSGNLAVEGLAGRVVLDRLAPPASAGPQELRARRLIAGVPVESPRAHFTLAPGRRGALVRIHEGVAGLAGGEISVEEARWEPAAERNAAEIRVRGVDLARLLSEWQIEGIAGTGRLSGVIPVRLGPAGLAIAEGRLEAAGPGVIRVDWGAARETLVNSGEQVALTVRALEDFHYEALTIGVERPADGSLTLAVGLEGASPEVLDGHPFRFNINLSGRLEPILAALREGRRIGAGLIGGGLGR